MILLILFLPLFVIIMIAIALDSPGNVIFIQKRAGKYSRPFSIFKFRTMSIAAPPNVATKELAGAHTYITRVGGFLRKTSLDELPQLWNILKGDMSFVGPRPVVLTETELLLLRRKLGADLIRPGITGLAQVRGRDTVTIRHKARYDAYYARHASFQLDLRVIVDTVLCVLTADGIQEGDEAMASSKRRKRQVRSR